MRRPDPGAPLYWFAAGDILSRDPERRAHAVTLDAAARLHRFHMAELARTAKSGCRAAHDYHRDRERELRLAIAAQSSWRRAAQAA